MDTPKKQRLIEDFVLRHYKHGTLDTQRAMRNVKARLDENQWTKDASPQMSDGSRWMKAGSRWRRYVAAIALVVVMVSAYALFTATRSQQQPAATEQTVTQPGIALQPQTFHFDDTPLPQVLSELGSYYGVTLTASDTTRHLTGDFEADDLDLLLDMIEQTLHVEIERQ